MDVRAGDVIFHSSGGDIKAIVEPKLSVRIVQGLPQGIGRTGRKMAAG